MSLLTPLYLLGALAIVAPILFHLIRRTPRGEVPFSSLMFLAPTPPKLTRRSRLDNLPLLLLRAAALALLALAFARPFLREVASLTSADGLRSRVVVLIDASASMRRGDLWAKAKAIAARAVADARADDQLAILAFDSAPRPVLAFEESATLDPARRLAVATARLDALAPTWAATDLGRALVEAVAAVEGVADASEKAGRMPRRVVLVSDLQRGSRLDALGDFQWPSDVLLEPRSVADPGPNASLHRLAETAESGPAAADGPVRVRVANEVGSGREVFSLRWLDAANREAPRPPDVYVPPGESRVVVVPRPAGPIPVLGLMLGGDAHPFDNTVALSATRKGESTVLYVGPDAPEDANGLLYYLGRVFEDTPRRIVRVEARSPPAAPAWDQDRPPALVVLAAEVDAASADRLKAYATGGGTVLVVVDRPGRLATLGALAGVSPPEAPDAAGRRDVMLGEIAFDHPLFAPLAGAQFSDFTKVRFWKHRRLDPKALGDSRVLARFEDGDPAVIEKPVGKGRLVVFTSGWAPADGQLARSSKFVPLMAALLDGRAARGDEAASYLVGDRVPLGPGEPGRARLVRKPDGSEVSLGPDAVAFDATDQPGVYSVATKAGEQAFAVDLDPAESRTSPLAIETLEQLGCRLASKAGSGEAADRDLLRQMQNGELEGRQKLWRWLILAAIGLLIIETWLAGRRPRPRHARAEVVAT